MVELAEDQLDCPQQAPHQLLRADAVELAAMDAVAEVAEVDLLVAKLFLAAVRVVMELS
jgi:hypothetical protein